MRGLARAMSSARSSPWLVSTITQKRISRALPVASSVSISCTSSADLTFGIMIDGGGASLSMIACRSFNPCAVDSALMRAIFSTCGWVSSRNRGSVSARPSSLRGKATASSMSTQTMSAPASSALWKRSGRRPGTNSRLRRGRIGRSRVLTGVDSLSGQAPC
jgi:hypothetical protein